MLKELFMKKLLILSIALFVMLSTSEAASLFRQAPQYYRIKKVPTHHQFHSSYVNNNSELSRMEQALFHQEYQNDNINTRLSRLEENMFGETVSGTIGQRYKNLSNAFTYNQSNPYYNPSGHYNTTPHLSEANKKLNIINKLANFLGGTPTGLSPSLDSEFSTSGLYSSPFGNGYFSQNRNFARGAGVQIIND